jgi:Tol biopolymer transport system component
LPEVLVYGGGATQFAVSETGTAVYGLPVGGGGASRRLVTVAADGADGVETLVPLPEDDFNNPRFSPDGRYIAYQAENDIWVYDQETGAASRLTTEGANMHPTWSSDGRYVYFGSLRPGAAGINGFRRLADGSADVELVFRRDQWNHPVSASPDGDRWLVSEQTEDRGMDLLIASEGPDSVELRAYLRAPWNETYGSISPDGRRVLYMADEAGGEIYVRSFPDALNQVRVVAGIGIEDGEPIWAPDGSAIYFRDAGQVMRATVTPGEEFRVGPPETLFEDRWLFNDSGMPSVSWDVSSDGRRFVFVRSRDGNTANGGGGLPVIPLEMVVNWFAELRGRVGSN